MENIYYLNADQQPTDTAIPLIPSDEGAWLGRLDPQNTADGKYLNPHYINDDGAFRSLYSHWIEPLMLYWIYFNFETNEVDKNMTKNDLLFLLSIKQTSNPPEDLLKDQQALLGKWRDGIIDPESPVINEALFNKIDQDIRSNLNGVSFYLQLRLILICTLVGRMPTDFFGNNCYTVLKPSILENLVDIPVTDGKTFTIEFSAAGDTLYPRKLVNKSDKLCRVTVKWNKDEYKDEYTVKVPPHGFVRALFADPEAQHLLELKGCISCNATHSVIQRPSDQNTESLYLYEPYRKPRRLLEGAHLYDAAAYQVCPDGGYIYRAATDIAQLHTNIGDLKPSEMPIRLYSSDVHWARLSENCLLETDFQSDGWKCKEGVIAVAEYVAEDGSNYLLFRTKTEAWQTVGDDIVKTTDAVFVYAMLNRFDSEEYCECVDRYKINLKGEVEWNG